MKKRHYGTGDLNLAAAFMSLGIPLIQEKPVSLIASTTGNDYKRFHFELVSVDGMQDVYALSAAWSNPETFRSKHPGHPFSKVMAFIASRPQDTRTEADWLDHAAAFLGLTRDAVGSAYRDIVKVCMSSPESEPSYVLAYVANRQWLIRKVTQMDSDGDFDVMQTIGKSIATISAKASKKTKEFILSHVKY